MLPKTSAYAKRYDRQTKWMYFLIDDDDILEKYTIRDKVSADGQTKWTYFLIENDDLMEKYKTIWDTFSADIKEEFDNELVYNKRFWKLK